MKMFTGFEYLCIDVANNFGLDKKRFEERIDWTLAHIHELEDLAKNRQWKQKPLYLKAVAALRKAQKGIPTGHRVGFDAVCSGLQLMSVLTGCEKGADATGLIDPDRRADAYSQCTEIMAGILGMHLPNERNRVKQALMTAFYGSKAEPKKEFGDGTPELNAFYKAMYQLAPGPTQLLEVLLDSWQPYALSHNWQLPDGFEARVRVMQRVEKDIEVDELNHSTFTYVYYENEGEEKGVKNAANIIHSIDGYVLRSLVRRCSFDPDLVRMAIDEIQTELVRRACGEYLLDAQCTKPVQKYFDLYQRTGMADIVVIEHLTTHDLQILPYEYIRKLLDILNTLDHNPFPIVTVHDDFTCHPNNMNHLRKHYRNILAELADSELISDILSQLHGYRGRFEKLSNNLSEKIRQSNYSLC